MALEPTRPIRLLEDSVIPPGHLALITFGYSPALPTPTVATSPRPRRAAEDRGRSDSPAAVLRSLAAVPMGVPSPDTWRMPQHDGRDICDEMTRLADLKRSGELDSALVLAVGCMNAMATAARLNPTIVMEHYVVETCVVLSKMHRWADEIEVIKAWQGLHMPASRDDARLRLEKRLAKAEQALAKSEGRDPSAYAARWHALVAEEKAAAGARQAPGGASTPVGDRTGRTRVAGQSRPAPVRSTPVPRTPRRGSSFLPTPAELQNREFIAVDFETANRQGGVSACQIAMVRFRDGAPVDRFTTFIRPPLGWDRFEFTWLHGISARDTRNAPMWDELAAPIAEFTGSSPVFAHNASFDARVWRQLDEFFGTTSMPDQFFCSLQLSRRLISGLPDYKLPTVVAACAPGHRFQHHRADADALACGLVVAHLQRLAL